MTFFGNIVYLRPCSVICSPRASRSGRKWHYAGANKQYSLKKSCYSLIINRYLWLQSWCEFSPLERNDFKRRGHFLIWNVCSLLTNELLGPVRGGLLFSLHLVTSGDIRFFRFMSRRQIANDIILWNICCCCFFSGNEELCFCSNKKNAKFTYTTIIRSHANVALETVWSVIGSGKRCWNVKTSTSQVGQKLHSHVVKWISVFKGNYSYFDPLQEKNYIYI